MKRGTLQHYRRRRILRIVLAIVSALFLLLSLAARAEESCVAGEACAESRPLDREFVTSLVGPPRGQPLEGAALAQKTHEIALRLRCPTCQGSSVADSPSATALNMKREVEDLLSAGYAPDQIFDYFEAAYGQFVLLEPKAEGLNLLVWIGPGILLLLGAAILVVYLRHRPEEEEAEPSPAAFSASRTQLPDDEELARWVRKVREIAYGWPGGEPPREAS